MQLKKRTRKLTRIDAWVLARLLLMRPVKSELTEVSDLVRGLAFELVTLKLPARKEAFVRWIKRQPDPSGIRMMLVNVDPDDPAPCLRGRMT